MREFKDLRCGSFNDGFYWFWYFGTASVATPVLCGGHPHPVLCGEDESLFIMVRVILANKLFIELTTKEQSVNQESHTTP